MNLVCHVIYGLTNYNITTNLTLPKYYLTEPVTPLTLSYDKIATEDPRSPLPFRTPLNNAQGIVRYDSSVVVCAPFTDETVIVSDAHGITLHFTSLTTHKTTMKYLKFPDPFKKQMNLMKPSQ